LSLARALKKADPQCRIIYIGHKGDRFDNLKERFHDFDAVAFVSAGKFRRYAGQSWLERLADIRTLILNARDLLRVFSSTTAAYRIMQRTKPNVVFSKGSFVALPVGIAARVRGVPIITHDSDAMPGLANRILGRWTKIHTTAMPAHFYSYPKSTVRHVGIPIDERTRRVTQPMQEHFKKQIGIEAAAPVLLIAGGGLGSQTVNKMVLAIAAKLLAENASLHIVHIAGQKNQEEAAEFYKKNLNSFIGKRVTVIGFSGEFYKYVGAADLIISRAGATSLAEFAAAAKATILIPSRFLTGGHQLKNAQELKRESAVEVVDENAPPEELYATITELLKDQKKRRQLAENLAATARLDAADKLAKIILDTAGEGT
jgi:UDP-N-acetylglucosamine--N-acetylmuramyl-(pentapeptide) pyrophosphoryl-undecaprenol N-acetylglucosamine transferase